MRLINCTSREIETQWAGGACPPYAILSHTWAQPGDGNPPEVTYQDYVAGRQASHSKNWDKIDKAIEISVKNGLGYIWIDNCCIDKTSSTELSEAINSMFKWYANAATCYAQIADFHDGNEADLRSCRWFYRGWTLQELIAPVHVEFFDKHWKPFGTRASLCRRISEITGVDTNVLSSNGQDLIRHLHGLTTAKKFSWARSRETTKPEDLAYCLLGIFDVNMELLYGEGENAFIRLQEHIMKKSDDLTLFAWQAGPDPTSPSRYRGILARSPREFSRSAELTQTNMAGFNPDFEMTQKGLRIKATLKKVKNSEDFWMSLNCRRWSPEAQVGIFLQNQGANRYIRSNAGRLEVEPGGEWTPTKEIFIEKDTSVSEFVEPASIHRNSFKFSIDNIRLEFLRVSHPDRWYEHEQALNTYGQPDFTGCYFFRSRRTAWIPAADLALTFGLAPDGKPWMCLAASRGCRARAGEKGKQWMTSDVYDAAANERWEDVRRMGMAASLHSLRLYEDNKYNKSTLLVAANLSKETPEAPSNTSGNAGIRVTCQPQSEGLFPLDWKTRNDPIQG